MEISFLPIGGKHLLSRDMTHRDGLWLNESFATFIACYALRYRNLCNWGEQGSKATQYKGDKPWQSFNSDYKLWAEREDQLQTTHPIQGNFH